MNQRIYTKRSQVVQKFKLTVPEIIAVIIWIIWLSRKDRRISVRDWHAHQVDILILVTVPSDLLFFIGLWVFPWTYKICQKWFQPLHSSPNSKIYSFNVQMFCNTWTWLIKFSLLKLGEKMGKWWQIGHT